MSREIHCANCTKFLGEIRDAKLCKGIVYLCLTCEKARKDISSRLQTLLKSKPENQFGDVFGDIFGGIGK